MQDFWATARGSVIALVAWAIIAAIWPSEFWRYAGAAINAVGVAAAAAAAVAYARWRRAR